MTLLAGFVAQVLHIALMAATAPTVTGVYRWMCARLAGRVGPSPLQPWRDLVRLLRKECVLAKSASSVTTCAPVVGAAAAATAACLVPSFAVGMTFAPLADLLMIAGLLMVGRVSLALVAMDAGSTSGGMGASRAMLLGCLAEPALLLVLFALALAAGSLNLDLIAGTRIENGVDWRPAVGIALAATLLQALAEGTRREDFAPEPGGRELAFIEATHALRLLVWFDLIGAMFVPFGMASSDDGPIAWLAGIAAWLFRTLLFTAVLALLHAALGRVRLPRSAQILGVAILLAFLAAVFVLADMTTV